MKCTIDNKYLTTLRGLATADNDAPDAARLLRLSANGKTISISGPGGDVDLPSQVERPGVLFIPAALFVDATAHLHTRHWINVDATPHLVRVNDQSLNLKKKDFKLVADPAKAPATWTPR
ncbi:MAG TPA: hypothetical protein PKE29_18000 [Phycisphaerales bacterium]|nr:hypothetical protein [Phycisphaerales bacterium]